LLLTVPSKEASMAESRDWKMADRRGNDDLMSGIGDEDVTGRMDDEEDDEEFEDAEDLEEDEDLEESER
jgi:hypothetical protein